MSEYEQAYRAKSGMGIQGFSSGWASWVELSG